MLQQINCSGSFCQVYVSKSNAPSGVLRLLDCMLPNVGEIDAHPEKMDSAQL